MSGSGSRRDRARAQVSLVVAAYRDPCSLRRMLAPLVRRDVEVLVVNVTADPGVELVCADLGVRHVPTPENVGFAAAVNVGVGAASGEVIVFANDDLGVAPDDLERLVTMAARVGVAVPRHVDPEGNTRYTIQPIVSCWTLFLEWLLLPDVPPRMLRGLPIQKWRLPDRSSRVPAATAAIVAARRDILEAHPLPEAYFLYWEEAEWFAVLGRAGVETWYVPDAVVVRSDGRSVVSVEKSRLMARNAVRVVRRVHGRRAAALAWIIVVGWNLRLWAVSVAPRGSGRRDPGAIQARRAGLLGAFRAIAEVR